MDNKNRNDRQRAWYYNTSEQSYEGPLTTQRVKEKINENLITEDTLIWRKGLIDWIKAEDASEFENLFKSPKPPPLPKLEKKSVTPPNSDKESEDEKSSDELKSDFNRSSKFKNTDQDGNTALNRKNEEQTLDKDISVRYLKFITYVILPFQIISILFSIPGYEESQMQNESYLMSAASIAFLMLLIYGLHSYRKWAWYLFVIWIGLLCFSAPLGLIGDSVLFASGILLSILVFIAHFIYFKKRKRLFS